MKRLLAAIALVGFAIRVAYGLIANVPSGFSDDVWFHAVANGLADGRGFSDPFHTLGANGTIEFFRAGGDAIATAFHPPLFPFLLTPFSAVGLDSYTAHQVVGCAIGAATVYVIGLLARQLGGDRAGIAAAAIAAVFLPMISREALLLSESLYGLLIALILLATLRLLDEPASTRRAIELGALIGLAALTRGEALLLVLLLLLPLLHHVSPRGIAVATVATLLVCLPWSIRNTAEFGQPTAITTGDGSVIAGSNLPRTYHGPDLGGFDVLGLYRTPAGRDVDPNEAVQSDRWRSEGVDYALDHASRLPVVLAARALRTWDLFPFAPRARADLGADQYHHVRALEYPSQLMLLAVVALAIAGGLAVRRRGSGPLWPFVVPVVLVTVVSLAGHGDPRYRHAADVSLVALAGVGAARVGMKGRA